MLPCCLGMNLFVFWSISCDLHLMDNVSSGPTLCRNRLGLQFITDGSFSSCGPGRWQAFLLLSPAGKQNFLSSSGEPTGPLFQLQLLSGPKASSSVATSTLKFCPQSLSYPVSASDSAHQAIVGFPFDFSHLGIPFLVFHLGYIWRKNYPVFLLVCLKDKFCFNSVRLSWFQDNGYFGTQSQEFWLFLPAGVSWVFFPGSVNLIPKIRYNSASQNWVSVTWCQSLI